MLNSKHFIILIDARSIASMKIDLVSEYDDDTNENESGAGKSEWMWGQIGDEEVQGEGKENISSFQDGDIIGVLTCNGQREADMTDEANGAGEERQRDVVEHEAFGHLEATRAG